jgi:hypothetical protein
MSFLMLPASNGEVGDVDQEQRRWPCASGRLVDNMPRAKEAATSIAEIIRAVLALSRSEKFQVAQVLLDDLAKEELPAAFTEGRVFPIYTPEYAPDAAAQMAQALMDEGTSARRSEPACVTRRSDSRRVGRISRTKRTGRSRAS